VKNEDEDVNCTEFSFLMVKKVMIW